MKLKIETPKVPNFIRVSTENGVETVHPIADFTETEVKGIIKAWGLQLRETAKRQRENKEKDSNGLRN